MTSDQNEAPEKDKGGGGPHHFEFFVDGKKLVTDQKHLTGAQIKALAGADSAYQLFLEQPGDDKPIADAFTVEMKNGMHFYTVPPATFGSSDVNLR